MPMIAVKFREEKPSSGYTIHVKSATENNASIAVHCELSYPTPGLIVTQAIPQPFKITNMQSSQKTERFNFYTLFL